MAGHQAKIGTMQRRKKPEAFVRHREENFEQWLLYNSKMSPKNQTLGEEN